jgi:hypothetical protein
MPDTVPDDIFALCSRFNLDLESYRVFPRPKRVSAIQKGSPSADPLSGIPAVNCSPLESLSNEPVEWSPLGTSTLQKLWTQVGLSSSRGAANPLPSLLKRRILVSGTARGPGTTTVVATLARLFSQKHLRCGIVSNEENDCPALPAALCPEFPIRILGRHSFESDLAKGDVQHELDQFLFDVESGSEPSDMANFLPAGVLVLVSVPDVNSILQAQHLKALYASKAPATPVIAVLNRFEPSLLLHREVRDSFAQTFSTIATLQRSDLAAEAFAAGMTVIDWSPCSELAQEYSQLFHCIREAMTRAQSPEVVTAC